MSDWYKTSDVVLILNGLEWDASVYFTIIKQLKESNIKRTFIGNSYYWYI